MDKLELILDRIATFKKPDDLKEFSSLRIDLLEGDQFDRIVDALEEKMLDSGLERDSEPNAFGIALDNMIGELYLRRRQSLEKN